VSDLLSREVAVRIGVRQRLIILIFSGLFVAMSLIGVYRYSKEKREFLNNARSHGAQTCKLIADLSAPYLIMNDYNGLRFLAENFVRTPDGQEVIIVNHEGRQLIHSARTDLPEKRIVIGPMGIMSGDTKLGEITLSVYPANLGAKLKTYAVGTITEHLSIFLLLAGLLLFSVTRTVTAPLKQVMNTLKDVIDRKDFTRRVITAHGDEIGELAENVNYLIERLEQFIIETGSIASRINELSPVIAADSREIRKSAEVEAEAVSNVSASVAQMSSSIHSIAESAESLTVSAEETSSAILEMNASNQEVARHTVELTSAVEDVTTSVTQLNASIREVAEHVDSLSSASEETSASAIEIEATVREVERAAMESAKLSQQVSAEAQDMGVRTIEETIKAINVIKEAVERYSGMVTRLGKRSEEIGKILGVIVEVTERTNLLALNASILAAQAGEHGRGFAVVAEEIKALADRTAGSAQDISKLVSSVQKEAKEAVAAMSDSLTAVDEGVRRSREAYAALDKILGSSTRSAEMAAMIERATTEQARGIKQVTQAISNVKQMTFQIREATHAQTKGTEMILHAAEEMRDISRRVTSAMAEQGRGGKQIAIAADNVTARSGRIATGTREQQQAIQQILGSVDRIQDIPRQNMKRMEGMIAAVKTVGEQSELLTHEIATMTVGTGHRDAKGATLRMGVIPLESPAEMYRRFSPLAEYLRKRVGKRVELLIATDFEGTIVNLEEGKTDLAFLTPTTYIEARKRCGVEILVKALRNGVPWMHSVIVVRSDSGMTTVEELRGMRVAFGDRLSTTSFLLPLAMLTEAGIGLDDLKSYAFLGHHDDVAKAILAREYDAGGLRESTAKAFSERGLSILKTSAEIPEFNICVSRTMDRKISLDLKKALLSLKRENREQQELLALIDPEYTGFVSAKDDDYDGIRKIVEKIAGTGAPK
jgi:phosphate/phosphite/phosphonate ABC transporter binding protein